MKKVAALAFALALSSPAAAATISFGADQPWTQSYQITGATGVIGWIYALSPEPLPLLDGAWGYSISAFSYNNLFEHLPNYEGLAGACYGSPFQCSPDVGGGNLGPVEVGDVLRFDYHGMWGSGPFLDIGSRTNLLLTFNDGVTLSPVPLPAAWLLLASMLGLGGLVRRWRWV